MDEVLRDEPELLLWDDVLLECEVDEVPPELCELDICVDDDGA